MRKYVCDVCGWIYDPEKGDPGDGIEPGTPVEDLPDDRVCPPGPPGPRGPVS